MDTVMAGFAEHAHQLICVDMTCSIEKYYRDWQIKERAGSNQGALSDEWNFRITEVMLKELGMLCNQF